MLAGLMAWSAHKMSVQGIGERLTSFAIFAMISPKVVRTRASFPLTVAN